MLKTLKKLIHYLSDGQFHSGAQLGKDLDITRSAVWKLVNQMRNLGIEIESVTKKGYRILNGLDLLNLKKIKKYIVKNNLKEVSTIEIFDQIGSTNDYLMRETSLHNGDIHVCLAEQQSQGKGRLGRKWLSPFGVNIYFSMLYPFSKDVSELAGLSLVVATIVADVLFDMGIKENIGLKWPNDVLWNNRKLVGILVEISGEAHGVNQAVIGIGINVNMPKSIAKSIGQPWVSVREIDEKAADRNKIIGLLINKLVKNLQLFQEKGFAVFHKRFQALDVLAGHSVQIETASEKIKGVACGIDDHGRFILKDPSGQQRVFSSGDVSVRRQRTED